MNRDNRSILFDGRRVFELLGLALLATGVAFGCGKDPSNNGGDGGSKGDGGSMRMADAGVDGETSQSDGGDTSTSDGGAPDGVADGGDTDGGGPCKVMEKNTDVDRDRDGLRNSCDNFKFLNHGGDNPKKATTITEDESTVPNDDARSGEAYGFELPVIIDGTVGPIEDDGDIDYYSFGIDEPTAILVHVEAKTSDFWPGAVAFGYEFRNQNNQLVLFGDDKGESSERELFLPVPGKYTLAVTDVRNLQDDSQVADVGGKKKYKYRVHFSKVPLPKAAEPGVPASESSSSNQRLNVYKVDASKLDGLELNATGVSVGMNSFLNPALAVYDPKNSRTLSYTIPEQVDSNTRKVSLTTKLDKSPDEVFVIESNISRFGKTSSKIELASATVDSEFETVQSPEDERADDLVWVQPGQSVDGSIGPPRTASGTSLSPDVDYFMLSAKRGQSFKVTVEPGDQSQLEPDVALGNYLTRQGGGSIFFDSRGHRVPGAQNSGDSRSVHFIFNSYSDGETAIRVRHAPNHGGGTPVGGSGYDYSVKVEPWSPKPVDIGMIPGQGQTTFKPGGLGVFKFQAQQGKIVRVTPEDPSGVNLFARGRATRKSDWRSVGRGTGTLEFVADKGGTYWYDVRDSSGGGTEGKNLTVQVGQRSLKEIKNLPTKINDMLMSGDDADYFKFAASKGDKLDFRAMASSFSPRIDVYTLPEFNRVAIGFGDETLHVEKSGDYAIRVSGSGSGSGSYTLGVQKIQPSGLGSVPISKSDKVDDEPFPDWYKFTASKGTVYEVNLAETGAMGFDARVDVFKGADLDRLDGTSGSTVRFRPDFNGDVYLAIYDGDQRGDPQYSYDVDVESVMVTQLTTGMATQGQLADGKDDALFTFSASPGAVDVEVTSQGAWTPDVQLLDAEGLDPVSGVDTHDGLARHATPEKGEYAVVVGAKDAMRSGPLKFTVTARTHGMSGNTTEMESNDKLSSAQKLTTFPAVVTGSLGNSGDEKDHYTVDLQSGQRFWAIAIPKTSSNQYNMRPEMTWYDPSGSQEEQNRYGGYGLWPAMHAEQPPTTGTWTIKLERQQMGTSGDYVLYVFTGDTITKSESEPNNTQSSAQKLGTIDAPALISATVDSSDSKDIFQFKLDRDLAQLRLFLENAQAGHDLRLLDNAFMQVAADGPNYGGSGQPQIVHQGLKAGTYYVEVAEGNGGGTLDLVMWPEP